MPVTTRIKKRPRKNSSIARSKAPRKPSFKKEDIERVWSLDGNREQPLTMRTLPLGFRLSPIELAQFEEALATTKYEDFSKWARDQARKLCLQYAKK